MKKTATFETMRSIDPGEIRHFVVELRLEKNEDFCSLQSFCLDASSSQSFHILDLSWVFEAERKSLLPDAVVAHIGRLDLPGILLPSGVFLQVSVKNFTSLPQICRGIVEFETISSKNDDSVVQEGSLPLLEKFKRWFKTGFEMAVFDKASPTPHTFRYPSVRDSVRSIVASLADLVEIPALAASLYWQHFAGGDEICGASIGLRGESSDPELVSAITIKVVPARPFRPTRIYGTAGFELVTFRVAGKDQLLSSDPLVFEEELGLAIAGEVATAGEEIEIVVRNMDAEDGSLFWGILDGLVSGR